MKPQPELKRKNQPTSTNLTNSGASGGAESAGAGEAASNFSQRMGADEKPWWQKDWFRQWERLARHER